MRTFGLRAKYAAGFGVLLLVVLVVAVGTQVWLSRLGGSVEVILQENYRSVIACQEMKEALERMDSGALFALAGNPEQGRTLVRLHGPIFEGALARELSNLTLPGERERAEHIGAIYSEFQETLTQVLSEGEPVELRQRLYFDRLLPIFQEIKRSADEVLRMNQEAMKAASVTARQLAHRGRSQMFFLSATGVLIAVLSVVFLSRVTLLPLRRLTHSVREIERGNLEPAVEVPQRDEIGELASAFNSMAERLRELRRSQRARLVRAQRTSSLAINSLRDGVILLSPAGAVELANPTAESLLGVRPGQPIPESHREWLDPVVAEAKREGSSTPRGYGETLQFFREGTERFYLPSAGAIREEGGPLVGVTVMLTDVTELRLLNEMKSDVVATVSHELMTPVTSLAMAVHILLEGQFGALTARQRELLVGAREDAERLRRIIEGILDVSRLEAGHSPLESQPLRVRELVDLAVEPLRAAYENKDVELLIDLDPEARWLRADRDRAPHILTNLLTNALRYSSAGGRVQITAKPLGDVVRFTVADSGPGVPTDSRERVFEKYHRGPECGGGAGLGLAIAREITEAHGGRIWCAAPTYGSDHEADGSTGATFQFELPAARTPATG